MTGKGTGRQDIFMKFMRLHSFALLMQFIIFLTMIQILYINIQKPEIFEQLDSIITLNNYTQQLYSAIIQEISEEL